MYILLKTAQNTIPQAVRIIEHIQMNTLKSD